MDVDDIQDTRPCPACAASASRWFIVCVEPGSLGIYSGKQCDGCGYSEGDHPEAWGLAYQPRAVDQLGGDLSARA